MVQLPIADGFKQGKSSKNAWISIIDGHHKMYLNFFYSMPHLGNSQ